MIIHRSLFGIVQKFSLFQRVIRNCKIFFHRFYSVADTFAFNGIKIWKKLGTKEKCTNSRPELLDSYHMAHMLSVISKSWLISLQYLSNTFPPTIAEFKLHHLSYRKSDAISNLYDSKYSSNSETAYFRNYVLLIQKLRTSSNSETT